MTIVIVFLLFFAFNLAWSLKLPDVNLDVSEQQTHTLSEPVKLFLGTLESPIDLYFFNSSNHPKKTSAIKNHGRRIASLLKQYEKAANGKITLHFIDPAPFSDDEYKARLLGLDDKQGFFGLIGTSASHGAQRIDAFDPNRASLLEYEISHLIHKVTQPQPPVIGLLSGLDVEGDTKGDTVTQPWRLLQEVRRQFSLLSLEDGIEQIPHTVRTLMLVHPGKLSDKTLYAVDQFVLSGGKLMMFIDPLSELETDNAMPAAASLEGLLASWGLEMAAQKALADRTFATTAVLTKGQPTALHPGALTLPRRAMAQDDISTWKVHTVTLLNSGALVPLKNGRTTFTPLLQSSGQAALFDLKRFAQPAEFGSLLSEAAERGQRHVIAARIEGPAYSAFADGTREQYNGLQKADRIHVVVVADTDLLSDRVAGFTQSNWGRNAPASDNALFVLNTLDHLAAPSALMNISPRPHSSRSPRLLATLREEAEHTYQEKTTELRLRLEQTEREWQLLNPHSISLGTEAVTSNSLLQALNKERLRLPIEIEALKTQAYTDVRVLERNVRLLNIIAVPLMLCLIALGLFLRRRRRQLTPSDAFY